VWVLAKLLAAQRQRRGIPCGSRALTCFWQAVLGLRWFRHRAAADALARDHGISRATAYRYLDEVVIVLAEQALDLREGLERATDEGFSHLILDGKFIPCDRRKESAVSVRSEVIDLWYSGKAHAHGGNVQAVLAPDGFPLWVSQAEPGSVHAHTAARAHALPALYPAAAAGLPALADPGYPGPPERPDAHPAEPRATRRRCEETNEPAPSRLFAGPVAHRARGCVRPRRTGGSRGRPSMSLYDARRRGAYCRAALSCSVAAAASSVASDPIARNVHSSVCLPAAAVPSGTSIPQAFWCFFAASRTWSRARR
jgi:DDE superfamily endonuclease